MSSLPIIPTQQADPLEDIDVHSNTIHVIEAECDGAEQVKAWRVLEELMPLEVAEPRLPGLTTGQRKELADLRNRRLQSGRRRPPTKCKPQ